jgi:hypothetical protein
MKLVFAMILIVFAGTAGASAQVPDQIKGWLLYEDKNVNASSQQSLPNEQFAKYIENRCKGREKCQIDLFSFSRSLREKSLRKDIRRGAISARVDVHCSAYTATWDIRHFWRGAETIQISCAK